MSASYHEAPSLSGPRPRAVLVDVGFTLTFWDGTRIAQHAAAAGVPVEPGAIERAEILVRGETRAAAFIHGEHLRSNVWRRVGAGNRDALDRLRAAGFRLAVVSNSEGTIDAMLSEVGLRPYFETVVDSAVVGSVKPDARIFQIALERLSL